MCLKLAKPKFFWKTNYKLNLWLFQNILVLFDPITTRYNDPGVKFDTFM